jgi:hypothetical protein
MVVKQGPNFLLCTSNRTSVSYWLQSRTPGRRCGRRKAAAEATSSFNGIVSSGGSTSPILFDPCFPATTNSPATAQAGTILAPPQPQSLPHDQHADVQTYGRHRHLVAYQYDRPY